MKFKPASADETTPYHELICAIVRQTIYDYRKKGYRRTEAAMFLQSREAQEFFGEWGLDLEYIRKRLEG